MVALNVAVKPPAFPELMVAVPLGDVTVACLVAVKLLLPKVIALVVGLRMLLPAFRYRQPTVTPVAVQLTLMVAVPPPDGAVTVGAAHVTAGAANEGLMRKQSRSPNNPGNKRLHQYRLTKSRFTEPYPSNQKIV